MDIKGFHCDGFGMNRGLCVIPPAAKWGEGKGRGCEGVGFESVALVPWFKRRQIPRHVRKGAREEMQGAITEDHCMSYSYSCS